MNSKDLHKHALPIVSLAVAGVVAVLALAVYARQHQLAGSNMASTLTTRTLSVKTTSSTTAQVHLGTTDQGAVLPTLPNTAYVVALHEALQQD